MAQDKNLIGLGALISKFEDLGYMEDGKILRSATRAAMVPVRKAAADKLVEADRPYWLKYIHGYIEPGYAKKHVREISFISQDKQVATAMVGTNKTAYYALFFVELGTSKKPARQWLRPAFYQNQNLIKETLADKFKAFFAKVAAKR